VERLVLLRRGSPETRVLAEGRATWGRLVSGDVIVYGVGDGRLFARIGTSEPREVTKLEGITQTVVPFGYRRFVAYSSTGEVARVDLTTDTIERTRVALGANGYLASDGANRIFIVDDRRLLAWDGAVTELATFDKRIYRLDPYDGGLLVYLSDYEVQALELSPGAKPVRILAPSRQPAIQSYDRKVVVNLGAQQQLNVVELPSRARWTLPVLFDVKDTIDISPSTRRLIQSSVRHFVIWTLPQAEPDLAAWLEELTNASLDPGGVLAWPWQRSRTP
jgi:hypothetical protein